MHLSRRALIVGGAALAASCAPATKTLKPVATIATVLPPEPLVPLIETAPPAPAVSRIAFDPNGWVRKDLLEGGLEAFESRRAITARDRMYLVDFAKHSREHRLFEVDMATGQVCRFRTAHGRGSDPAHVGFAQRFSNTPESNASSVGAFVTAGRSEGPKHGPNVLLEGLDPTNNLAMDRAIIVHGADYCELGHLLRHGKLGRSYGCFSTSPSDLQLLRPRLDEGRLLYAAA